MDAVMARADAFAAELTREAVTTRRILERVPEEHFGWKPHAKSMSLGQLAQHIARLPRSISILLSELEAGPPNVPLPQPTTVADLLTTLDEAVPFAIETLTSWGDEGLSKTWRMSREGQTIFEQPRYTMVRSIMLNHWYHHRGQLTVYLRLLDVPLPSVYGPTADEKPFG
jgi:uncharacterized damage-inducible protein DinB